jgi:drug/metabolite transporter (DMT)-like permease
MFIGSLVLFGAILLLGKADVLMSLTGTQVANLFVSTGFLFGYVFFWYWAIKNVEVGRAAALLLIAPIISLVLGMWWFAEPLSAMQAAGSALILIGGYVVIRAKKQTQALETL